MQPKKYLKKSWISPKVEERNSPAHGRGLFAIEPIKAGEVVIWGGDFVDQEGAQGAKQEGKAVQQIGENLYDVFAYETRNEDPSYNHNHSCDPNTWMDDEVTISARRDINPEEELTIDYAVFLIDDNYLMPGECKCGSNFCRDVITGKDWQRKDLQEKYKDHFSPYLNLRIQQVNLISKP